jgi:hypothetical protein
MGKPRNFGFFRRHKGGKERHNTMRGYRTKLKISLNNGEGLDESHRSQGA